MQHDLARHSGQGQLRYGLFNGVSGRRPSEAGLQRALVLPGMGVAMLQQGKTLVALRTDNPAATVFTDGGYDLELFAAPFTTVFIDRHGDLLSNSARNCFYFRTNV
jgi:hypothetical protein